MKQYTKGLSALLLLVALLGCKEACMDCLAENYGDDDCAYDDVGREGSYEVYDSVLVDGVWIQNQNPSIMRVDFDQCRGSYRLQDLRLLDVEHSKVFIYAKHEGDRLSMEEQGMLDHTEHPYAFGMEEQSTGSFTGDSIFLHLFYELNGEDIEQEFWGRKRR